MGSSNSEIIAASAGSLPLDAGRSTCTILAACADRFIEAWEHGEDGPPALRDYLPPEGALRRLALVELVKIDLEYRWVIHHLPRQIEEYLAEFPEIAEDGIPTDLLYEEYHVRRQAGLQVDPREYARRFPANVQALQRLIGGAATGSTQALPRKPPQSLRDLKPGDSVDDFDLLVLLGKGAFAAVFLARQKSMQRLVALKVSSNRGAEPQTLAQLDHDHIVRVFDQRELPADGMRLLYMQYVAGGTLEDALRRFGAISPALRSGQTLLDAVDAALEQRGESRPVDSATRARIAGYSWPQSVCWLGSRLALALECAHRRGVLHRDVKPANVLLTAEAVPKLADFNVSFCSKLNGASPAAYFGGSLVYMSPEQLEACNPAHERGPESLDGRSDLYSLGVVLWELLAGSRPFRDPPAVAGWSYTLDQLAQSRRQGIDAAQLDRCLQCSPGIRAVLRRALEPDPANRFQNGGELARQLELCTDAQIQQYLHPAASSWRVRLRPYALWAVLATTLLPSLAAAVFNFLYNHQQIVSRMPAQAESHFMTVQTIINGTGFPAGLALMAWLSWPAVRATGSRSSGQPPQRRLKRALYLGHHAAWICVVLWTLAGLAYPLSMRLGDFAMPGWTYVHFFASLLLCGLFAVSLNFFGVTALSLRIVLPPLVEPRPIDAPAAVLDKVLKSCWAYLAMSASVPMLATAALVGADNPNTRWYLLAISLGGVAAFVLVVFLFRLILRDLELLIRIAHGPES